MLPRPGESRATPHYAYADESGSGADRFCSVAVVSGPAEGIHHLRASIQQAYGGSPLTEWKDVNGDRKHSEAAWCMLRCAVETILQHPVRIDVLVWDKHDRRHRVPGRDDVANLARMYYRALIHAARQWSHPTWVITADEHTALPWERIADFVRQTRVVKRGAQLYLAIMDDRRTFQASVKTVKSSDELLVRVADLFAGLGRYLREQAAANYRAWHAWRDSVESRHLQLGLALPGLEGLSEPPLTGSARARFELVFRLNALVSSHRMGVSLETQGYFVTHRPWLPLNFWHYTPQHDRDRAPVKTSYTEVANSSTGTLAEMTGFQTIKRPRHVYSKHAR